MNFCSTKKFAVVIFQIAILHKIHHIAFCLVMLSLFLFCIIILNLLAAGQVVLPLPLFLWFQTNQPTVSFARFSAVRSIAVTARCSHTVSKPSDYPGWVVALTICRALSNPTSEGTCRCVCFTGTDSILTLLQYSSSEQDH